MKRFISLGNLKAHEDFHFGNKPYVCSVEGCGKRYSRKIRLFVHFRTHVIRIFYFRREKSLINVILKDVISFLMKKEI
jgi:uncharacterized Zn-finger protein